MYSYNNTNLGFQDLLRTSALLQKAPRFFRRRSRLPPALRRLDIGISETFPPRDPSTATTAAVKRVSIFPASPRNRG